MGMRYNAMLVKLNPMIFVDLGLDDLLFYSVSVDLYAIILNTMLYYHGEIRCDMTLPDFATWQKSTTPLRRGQNFLFSLIIYRNIYSITLK